MIFLVEKQEEYKKSIKTDGNKELQMKHLQTPKAFIHSFVILKGMVQFFIV